MVLISLQCIFWNINYEPSLKAEHNWQMIGNLASNVLLSILVISLCHDDDDGDDVNSSDPLYFLRCGIDDVLWHSHQYAIAYVQFDAINVGVLYITLHFGFPIHPNTFYVNDRTESTSVIHFK